ncbi:MAG: hypothetical protein WC612_07055 [Bdellovibrionales bacterium]
MRNLFVLILLCLCLPVPVQAGVLSTSGEIQTGPREAPADKTISVDSVLDGVSGVFDSVVSTISDGSLPKSDEKNDAKKAEVKESPALIKAKRLETDKETSAQNGPPRKDEPSAPYKVYTAPMIADDPPVVIDPAPPSSRVDSVQGDGFEGWQTQAPKTVDLSKPPALTEEAKKAAGLDVEREDVLYAPEGKAGKTERGRGIPPIAALPKQFIPILPMGFGAKAAPQLLPVASSVALDEDQTQVKRVIVFIHDMTRNAADGIATLMTLSGSEGEQTLILAPQFPLDVDIVRFAKYLPDSGRQVARWRIEDGWQWGGESTLGAGQRGISSYTALDILLLYLSDRERFPMLEKVILAGHGQGGDFVQRYAAVGKAPSVLKKEGLPMRYVVANPSSYLYMTASRPSPESARFIAPDVASCPNVNDYPYGLASLSSYAKSAGANAIRLDYPEKPVLYLVGDKILIDHYLDRSCAAMAQGPDRTVRGKNYGQYLSKSFGETAFGHMMTIVPNAGYDPVSLFGSSCGMAALFGDGRC